MLAALRKMHIKPGMQGIVVGLPQNLDLSEAQSGGISLFQTGHDLDFGLVFVRVWSAMRARPADQVGK